MSAARRVKPVPKPSRRPLAGLASWIAGRGRPLVLAMLAVGTVLLVGRAIWNFARPMVLARGEFRLDPERIIVTPQPDWIRADVRAEVIRDGNLGPDLSMEDDDLAHRVRDAFELHAWVAQAKVTKRYPSRVEVELTYRRPAAMVQLLGAGDLDLIPIDDEGFRLPGDDFSAIEKRRYPRLTGIITLPPVGQRASDPRVAGGARLARLLGDAWQELDLVRIVALPAERSESDRSALYRFELVTRGGTRILWGSAPGGDEGDAVDPQEKLTRLRALLKQHAASDGVSPTLLDLAQPPPTPRTASAPSVPANTEN